MISTKREITIEMAIYPDRLWNLVMMGILMILGSNLLQSILQSINVETILRA